MLGTGRSYLGFFLRGWGLTARGGRQGTWFSLKKVTIKGCLDRGPLRPTKPIQPADKERSGRLYEERRAEIKELRLEREIWLFLWCNVVANSHPPLFPRRDVFPGCCGGWAASGWKLWWRQRPANPPDLQAPTAHPEEPGLAPFKEKLTLIFLHYFVMLVCTK